MPKIPHHAFKNEYPHFPRRLTTEAKIFDSPFGAMKTGIKVFALWDTGATGSAITPNVVQKLSLKPFNRVPVSGVNNTSEADVVKISIGLPNLVKVEDVNAMVCDLGGGIDLIIGMDIILLGDFSISNGNGKTLFSFAMPPFENKADLYEKALAVNKRNKK